MARKQLTAAWLRAMLGPDASVEATTGTPVVAPQHDEQCALLLQAAHHQAWRVRVEGTGHWMPRDAPADLVITTRNLRRPPLVQPADFVATVDAGVPMDQLRATLADRGTWLATDAPGTNRSLGSALATGTPGPLRAGFGPMRDQVLGLTMVTGDGRTVTVGGQVVKNVAGYDLAKLAAGGFGAFGVITSMHLRLHAVPRADVTLLASGVRDVLLDAARRILESGPSPAALEVFSPRAMERSEWGLAVRSLGSETEVAAERVAVADAAGLSFEEVTGPAAATFWRDRMAGVTAQPMTLRVGALPTSLSTALDLLAHHVDEPVEDWISVTVPAGTVRWSGSGRPTHLALLRRTAAEHEMPLTLERAPWDVRTRLGHFGAYREHVARLVNALRHSFDPGGVLTVPLGEE